MNYVSKPKICLQRTLSLRIMCKVGQYCYWWFRITFFNSPSYKILCNIVIGGCTVLYQVILGRTCMLNKTLLNSKWELFKHMTKFISPSIQVPSIQDSQETKYIFYLHFISNLQPPREEFYEL